MSKILPNEESSNSVYYQRCQDRSSQQTRLIVQSTAVDKIPQSKSVNGKRDRGFTHSVVSYHNIVDTINPEMVLRDSSESLPKKSTTSIVRDAVQSKIIDRALRN